MAYQTGMGSGVRGCSLEISETLLDLFELALHQAGSFEKIGAAILIQKAVGNKFSFECFKERTGNRGNEKDGVTKEGSRVTK